MTTFKFEPESNSVEELLVVPCSSVSEYDAIFEDKSLYCLADYNSYAVEGSTYDEVFKELQVTFEACTGEGCKSVSETEAYLEDKEFKFPYQ